ncbi:Elicitin, partial [Phytophthora megakarya]
SATTAPTSTTGSVGSDLGSPFLSGSSATPSPASTSSTTSCTTSQVANIVSMYKQAATTSNCQPDATTGPYSVYIFTKCGSSCATKLKLLAGDLPNCYYDYESANKKASLLEQIDDCTGDNSATSITDEMSYLYMELVMLISEVNSTTMPYFPALTLLTILVNMALVASTSSSDSVNGSTSWSPSERNCSSQEITIMRKLYIGVAATTACATGSTVDRNEIYVHSECSSLCTPVLQNLEEALPNCYYYLSGFEDSNKKWDAYSSLVQCDQGTPVWVRFHSNKTISAALLVLHQNEAYGLALYSLQW